MKKLVSSSIIIILFLSLISFVSARMNQQGGSAVANIKKDNAGLGKFAFYYPWYATPDFSGKWGQWDRFGHDPDKITDGKRDIVAADYPLLGPYDSNNETVIKQHIDIAKNAGIDCFIVSWWGRNTFTDDAARHVRSVCEQENFNFTFYYESTSSLQQTQADLEYILKNYVNSSAFYKVDGRPVIFVYSRAREELNPSQDWKFHGYEENETAGTKIQWFLNEPIRRPARYGIFPIEPNKNEAGSDGIGCIESTQPIFLAPNETYVLKAGISDIRNDAGPYSDVGFRIKISNGKEWKSLLNDMIVNFNDGWLDFNFSISEYAGQNVTIRVESFAGGQESWNSEWAAVDYFYIENSRGEIVSPSPFLDNDWKTVLENLSGTGYDPFVCMDFGGYETQVQDFAEYFLNFTDGIHSFNHLGFLERPSVLLDVYLKASNAAHAKNKIFIATVMPGFDNSALSRDQQPILLKRYNGTYYRLLWSIGKACDPDGYAVTTFNEWLEGTEIEPSLQYGYQYVDLTRDTPNVWTVNNDGLADFATIQEGINGASLGDAIVVSNGTYAEGQINVTKGLTLLANGTVTLDALGQRDGIYIAASNVAVDGFRIQNINRNGCAIEADKSGDLLFMENTATDGSGKGGIMLSNCGESLVRYNILFNTSSSGAGILLEACSEVTVTDNELAENGYGIRLINSSNNDISLNHVRANKISGVELSDSSDYDRISANDIETNAVGISCASSSDHANVTENNIRKNGQGLILWKCSGNGISANNITDSDDRGIFLQESIEDSVFKNNITNCMTGLVISASSYSNISSNWVANTRDGIRLDSYSNHNTISENNISANNQHGVLAEGSTNNNIVGNTIAKNEVGITFINSSSSRISRNSITENKAIGLKLYNSFGNDISLNDLYANNLSVSFDYFSKNNIVSLNNVTQNTLGISLSALSTNNTLLGNNVGNNQNGIDINSSQNVFYHNNFLNNTRHVICVDGCMNGWDAGYLSGGNYWSDFTGRDLYFGPLQNETGCDWIGDSPYVIDENNSDKYPLTGLFVPEMEEIKTAYRRLLLRYMETRSDLNALNSTLLKLNDTVLNLEEKCDSLANETAAQQQHIDNLTLTYGELKKSLDNLTHVVESLQEQIGSLNGRVDSIQNMIYVLMAVIVILIVFVVCIVIRKQRPGQPASNRLRR